MSSESVARLSAASRTANAVLTGAVAGLLADNEAIADFAFAGRYRIVGNNVYPENNSLCTLGSSEPPTAKSWRYNPTGGVLVFTTVSRWTDGISRGVVDVVLNNVGYDDNGFAPLYNRNPNTGFVITKSFTGPFEERVLFWDK
ncbi:MAG TPA: hypothetical protein VGJ05_10950 [Fimbriiglobus sp.]|jgi:hypothetical protein